MACRKTNQQTSIRFLLSPFFLYTSCITSPSFQYNITLPLFLPFSDIFLFHFFSFIYVSFSSLLTAIFSFLSNFIFHPICFSSFLLIFFTVSQSLGSSSALVVAICRFQRRFRNERKTRRF